MPTITDQPYTLRYNSKHRGYLLVSCCFGHTVRCIHTGRKFGGSMDEADLAFDKIRCRECKREGRKYAPEMAAV